jgi:DNA-binding IclR family transcriptional regulator
MSVKEAAGSAARNNSSSLRRALGVLRYVADNSDRRHLGLADIAAGTQLPKSTLKRLVIPLVEEGLLRQHPSTGGYALGAYTAYLGGQYLEGLDLRELGRPILERLTAQTSETAHLVIRDGFDVVYIDKVDSPNPVRMYSRIGNRLPMYCTATGKAMLSHLPSSDLDELLSNELPQLTPTTLTKPAALRRAVAVARENGYAVDNGENEPGIRCAGAAILDQARRPIGALSISAPDGRVSDGRLRELGGLVRSAAAEISAGLGLAEAHQSDPVLTADFDAPGATSSMSSWSH